MEIDILIEDSRWETSGIDELAQAAVSETCRHLGLDAALVDVSLLACDNARIAVLNADFRGKPAPTNVLSWPSEDLAAQLAGRAPAAPRPGPDGTIALGDIAMSYDTCAREAAEMDKPFAEHVTHLIVHGTLHLLGYDHIRDPDATLMQAIETEILGKMGLNDPYRE